MQQVKTDLIIVGAGLSGLALAYFLRNSGKKIQILEASNRVGGRIFTLRPNGPQSHIEMGATWFGAKHTSLVGLLDELEIPHFHQFQMGKALFQSMSFTKAQSFFIPEEQSDPTFRIQGGSGRIIDQLVAKLSAKTDLLLNTPVKNMTYLEQSGDFLIKHSDREFIAPQVVIAVPPINGQKVLQHVDMIENSTLEVLKQTHTWMHDSIKFGLITDKAYWRALNFSGTFFSQVGPVVEMYDHCNVEQDFFALKGFLSGTMSRYTFEERRQKVFDQLTANLPFFDPEKFHYTDKVWVHDSWLNQTQSNALFPHQNNGNPLLRKALIPDKLWLAASETAVSFPGYMDGAVQRAKELAELLSN